MNITPSTFSTVSRSSELVTQLEQGCAWAEIDRGRATRYGKLITEFFDGTGVSREHILAHYEADEIAEIYKLWSPRVEDFPGLKGRICEAIKSGPLLREDENLATSSNRPRNDVFGFFIAGRLLAAGCQVLAVEGVNRSTEGGRWVGDVTVRQGEVTLDIQCKRPQTAEAVGVNIERAKKQILRATCPRMGIVGVDLSVIIRPPGTFLPTFGVASASNKLSDLVQTHAKAVTDAMLGPQIAGIIWFGKIPCRITQPSRIVKPAGGQYEITRPYIAREMTFTMNASSPYVGALRSVGEQLSRWSKSR